MILQELVQYYERQRQNAGSGIAPPGWVRRPIDYALVLSADGDWKGVLQRFTVEKGKRIGQSALLPAIGKQALKHTNSGKDANLLWDNAKFVLGIGDPAVSRLVSFHETALQWFHGTEDDGLRAVLLFLDGIRTTPDAVRTQLEYFGVLADFEQRDPVLAFQLLGDSSGFVHERAALRAAYALRCAGDNLEAVRGNCLVSGDQGVVLASNETVIKGVWGGQTSGTNLVSFNAASFVSYGKRDRTGENAPVGAAASSAYSTALNHLLDSKASRVQVGDASTVFWADRPTPRFPSLLSDLFGEHKDDPGLRTQAVQTLFQAVESGQLPVEEGDARFFVLGLAPNAARISVRFWLTKRLSELAPDILRHFVDIRVVPRYDSDPPVPSLFRLLSALALQGKADNVPPRLAGEWLRAIIEGRPCPPALLNLAVTRCKAEQDVTYLRAAVLKACLNRAYRETHTDCPPAHQHFKESLDMAQDDNPYLLGRLFAVLERAQEQSALPAKLNSTIRDRYYGAASTTPGSVFPSLLRLKDAHVKKMTAGPARGFEIRIGEIFGPLSRPLLNDFPRQLTLPQQGRFALGYYHQRQDFYTRKNDVDSPVETSTEEETTP